MHMLSAWHQANLEQKCVYPKFRVKNNNLEGISECITLCLYLLPIYEIMVGVASALK